QLFNTQAFQADMCSTAPPAWNGSTDPLRPADGGVGRGGRGRPSSAVAIPEPLRPLSSQPLQPAAPPADTSPAGRAVAPRCRKANPIALPCRGPLRHAGQT